MKRAALALLVSVLMALMPSMSAAAGSGAEEGEHSKNIVELAHMPLNIVKGQSVTGTDFAFQGNLVVAGSYQGIGLYRITPGAPYLKQIGSLHCEGGQGDVSIWGNLVFMSVDSARVGPECTTKDMAPADPGSAAQSTAWEGVRIIDISNPQQPKEVKAVYTDCGSHTHTLSPDGKVLYIYVQSYPLGAPAPKCNPASHNKISVIKVPLDDPASAEVVSTPSVAPAIGCHDVTVVPPKHLAVAACISESQVWDIKDPANPTVLAHIYNPEINIHHSSQLTWDGKILALGDETGGGGANGCAGQQDSTTGAMWFYDLTDPSNPQQVGHYALPRTPAPDEVCTTHNFDIIPMNDPKKYIATPAYYDGGL
ncbi:MAG TPA: hypothetical protein VFK89_06535, partial [Actinomycetota bacterium]|nr:hypothetical protein [Actinomycetota bacterium]